MVMKQGTKTITFRVAEDLHSKIVAEAKKEERSVNNFVTYAVKEYIENKTQNAKNKGCD